MRFIENFRYIGRSIYERVSLKDIAGNAGVSSALVSDVLNDQEKRPDRQW